MRPPPFRKAVWLRLASVLLIPGFAGVSSVRAAQTVVARETFQGVGTINGSSPGAFGAVLNGAWQKRAVGPRTAAIAAPGWSGDAQGADTDASISLTTTPGNAAQTSGMFGAWVRYVDFSQAGYIATGYGDPALTLSVQRADGYMFQYLGVTAAGHLVGTSGGAIMDGGAIAPNTWYWLQIDWVHGSNYSYRASYTPPGGKPVVIGTTTDASAPATVHAQNQPYTYPPPQYQDYRWRGRIGNVTLCAISSLSDATVPADDLAPAAGPFNWYVNPVTGNDANTGATPSAPWASAAKFNAESANAGLFGGNACGGGDTVYFDTSAAPLDPGTGQLLPRTPNLTLRPAAGQAAWTIKPWKDISGAGTVWTQYDPANHPNVWTTTDGGATDLGDGTYGNVCVWENDAWLAHPNGTSIDNVAAALDATPGSFWASTSAIYLRPSDGANPNTNGKVYTRSRNRGGNGGNGAGSGASLVYAANAAVQIIGLNLRKTCLVQANNGDPYNGYGIQLDGTVPAGSTSRLLDCHVEYTSKHGIGRTDSSSGHTVNVESCGVEQCTAYSNSSSYVDYNGNAAATGNVSNWINCTNHYPFGVAGYAVPDYALTGYPQSSSYLSHNNGSGVQYASINFVNPVFGGLITGGPAASVTIAGGSILNAMFNVAATIQQCAITGFAPSLATGSVLRNCKIVSTQAALYPGSYAYLSGNVQMIGNTFDFSHPYRIPGGYGPYPLFNRNGALQLTFENNLVITAGQNFTVLKGAASTDTLTFSHNAFDPGGNAYVLDGYNDGATTANRTLAQVQALGLDTGSFPTTDPKIDPDGFPAPGSPLADAGVDLGALVDFSGRGFSARRTIGALEPLDTFAHWQAQRFSPAEIATASVGGPAADPDGDGQCNVLEYALATDPKAAGASGLTTGMLSIDGALYLSLTYRQRAYVGDLTYTPEVSSDLLHWQTGPGTFTFFSRVDNGDGTLTTTVHDAVSVGAGPARFLRLRVTGP